MFLNDNEYKLVYVDTNVLSEFVNDTKNFRKNFAKKYLNGKYMLVTSPFNILELNETELNFIEKAIEIYNFPIGILNGLENICNYNRNGIDIGYEIIMFAVFPLYKTTFRDLINIVNHPSTQRNIQERNERIYKEIIEWNNKKNDKDIKWQQNYIKNIKISMQEIVNHFPEPFAIDNIKKYQSLQTVAHIKNMFIHNTNDAIMKNSIIDSYNVAYLPYIDEYVSERTVCSWLDMSKNKLEYLKDKNIVKLSTFFSEE